MNTTSFEKGQDQYKHNMKPFEINFLFSSKRFPPIMEIRELLKTFSNQGKTGFSAKNSNQGTFFQNHFQTF